MIDKRLVVTSDAFWAIPEIVPRKLARRGYMSYPNFTQYHMQHMISPPDQQFFYQQRRQRQRRSHRHGFHLR